MEPAASKSNGVVENLRKLVATIPAPAKVIALFREFGEFNVRNFDGISVEMVACERARRNVAMDYFFDALVAELAPVENEAYVV